MVARLADQALDWPEDRRDGPARYRVPRTEDCTLSSEELPRLVKQRRAHSAVALGLKDGTLQQEPCELCGEPVTVAHHDDYDKPLDVRWLCASHHTLVHNAVNRDRDKSADWRGLIESGTMTFRTFRDRVETVERVTMVVRLVDGEYVKLGLWIPARKTEG
jgi:ribosomal protein S27AE